MHIEVHSPCRCFLWIILLSNIYKLTGDNSTCKLNFSDFLMLINVLKQLRLPWTEETISVSLIRFIQCREVVREEMCLQLHLLWRGCIWVPAWGLPSSWTLTVCNIPLQNPGLDSLLTWLYWIKPKENILKKSCGLDPNASCVDTHTHTGAAANTLLILLFLCRHSTSSACAWAFNFKCASLSTINDIKRGVCGMWTYSSYRNQSGAALQVTAMIRNTKTD